jgi:hypothetical protein
MLKKIGLRTLPWIVTVVVSLFAAERINAFQNEGRHCWTLQRHNVEYRVCAEWDTQLIGSMVTTRIYNADDSLRAEAVTWVFLSWFFNKDLHDYKGIVDA